MINEMKSRNPKDLRLFCFNSPSVNSIEIAEIQNSEIWKKTLFLMHRF